MLVQAYISNLSQSNLDRLNTIIDKLVSWDYAAAKYKGQDAGVDV
ncbi:hypothetical protein CZ794_03995 [Psychrobacter sp. JB385]|nr:hypothetical protein CZ794_03995 [Psychrobacter sp. JB385]